MQLLCKLKRFRVTLNCFGTVSCVGIYYSKCIQTLAEQGVILNCTSQPNGLGGWFNSSKWLPEHVEVLTGIQQRRNSNSCAFQSMNPAQHSNALVYLIDRVASRCLQIAPYDSLDVFQRTSHSFGCW